MAKSFKELIQEKKDTTLQQSIIDGKRLVDKDYNEYPNYLKLEDIIVDHKYQARVKINKSVVNRYAEAMLRNVLFPEVTIYVIDSKYYLVDGFHRYYATMKAREKKPDKFHSLRVKCTKGTEDDAFIFSLSRNDNHGLQRNNADIRNAVRKALLHPIIQKWSSRRIAKEVCSCSFPTVNNIRIEMETTGEIPRYEKYIVTRTRNGITSEFEVDRDKPVNIRRKQNKSSKPDVNSKESLQKYFTSVNKLANTIGIDHKILMREAIDILIDIHMDKIKAKI